jgi:hypothetical protein
MIFGLLHLLNSLLHFYTELLLYLRCWLYFRVIEALLLLICRDYNVARRVADRRNVVGERCRRSDTVMELLLDEDHT